MANLMLPKEYALVLLRKLADDDAYRSLYSKDPAQALLSIGVPSNLVSQLPAGYAGIKLGSKSIFQEALYQVIDDVATICICQIPPQVHLALGEGPDKKSVTTPFGSS